MPLQPPLSKNLLLINYAKNKKTPSQKRENHEIYTLFPQLWWNYVISAEYKRQYWWNKRRKYCLVLQLMLCLGRLTQGIFM